MCLTHVVFDKTNVWNPLSLGASVGKSDIDSYNRKQKVARKQIFRLWKSFDCGSSANSLLKFKSKGSLFSGDYFCWRTINTFENHSFRIIGQRHFWFLICWSSLFATRFGAEARKLTPRKEAMENNETLSKGWFSYFFHSCFVINIFRSVFEWKIIAIQGVLLSFTRL